MESLRRIAAIHDLSGVGKCSLTVALPVVSASGVECSCMPTAVLSTHTGEFTGYTVRDLTEDMEPMAVHWAREGVRFDGIYSGYLTNPEQVEVLKRVIELLSGDGTMLIVDPVMADNGKYYTGFGERMCQAFRGLCAQAEVITPNVTEAALLTGLPLPEKPPYGSAYIEKLLRGLEELGPRVIAITGVHPDDSAGKIGMVALDRADGSVYTAFGPEREGLFFGTGDIFASAFAALLVRGASVGDALDAAAGLVADSITRSLGRELPRRFGVDFEGALPAYIRRVEKIFGR